MSNLYTMFDGVFYLNLPERYDRNDRIKSRLANAGLEGVCRFPAIRVPHHPEMGCALSHLSLIGYAFQQGMESILIFEDDAVFCENFIAKANKYLSDVPDNWEMIYFGGMSWIPNGENQFYNKRPKDFRPNHLQGNCYRVVNGWQTHAYAIKTKMFAEAYWMDDLRIPIDEAYINFIHKAWDLDSSYHYNCYGIMDGGDEFELEWGLIRQDDSVSDIEKYRKRKAVGDDWEDIRVSCFPNGEKLLESGDKNLAMKEFERGALLSCPRCQEELSTGNPLWRSVHEVSKRLPFQFTGSVSVVIPCYNDEQNLYRSVGSVVAQETEVDVEVVIVNDGGDKEKFDEVVFHLKKMCEFPIIVETTENRGPSAARNRAVELSSHPWLLLLDSDDYLTTGYIEKGMSALKHGADVVFTDIESAIGGEKNIEYHPLEIRYGNQLPMTSIVRKSLWQYLGGLDDNMKLGFEDWEFWIRCTKYGARFVKAEGTGMYYDHKNDDTSRDKVATDRYDEVIGYIMAKHPELYRHHMAKAKIRKYRETVLVSYGVLSEEDDCLSDLTKGRFCHINGDKEYHKGNQEAAFSIWLRGAKYGDLQCMKNVAWAYGSGIGISESKDKSEFWLERHREAEREHEVS